jgi:hypothetical protein
MSGAVDCIDKVLEWPVEKAWVDAAKRLYNQAFQGKFLAEQ